MQSKEIVSTLGLRSTRSFRLSSPFSQHPHFTALARFVSGPLGKGSNPLPTLSSCQPVISWRVDGDSSSVGVATGP
jgi:hypothetical protein